MDHRQAFNAMTRFLDLHYQRTKSDDVGSLLGDIRLLGDGCTSDPAAWGEWLDCVELSVEDEQHDGIQDADRPPDLHDWMLRSINVGRDKASLGFSSPNGTDHCHLTLEGVQDLVCDDLREGNIVLSLDIGIEHVTRESLCRLLYVDQDSKQPRSQITRMQDKLTSGELQFVRIMPSYGADIVITANSISFLIIREVHPVFC